uniref:NADH dehydrogenase subunit 6 n=1 Tax=Paratapes textilis TaxID=990946 RepID=H6BHU4_9BIVA|nr:NADH dehydrogenase subunit 6 [Paratapes textilis]AEH99634.1 NADH dehydrogenase subunit 6 [Paratapes textilis]
MLEIFIMACCLGSMNIMSRYDHPMYFGFALLVLVASMSGAVSAYSGVYGFMIFMCIVSGILVVFAYSVALVPLMMEKSESDVVFSEYKNKMKFLGVFTMGWVAMVISILMIICFYVFGGFVDGYSSTSCFQSILYVSNDWGVAMTLFGVLLFLVMVFSVGIAGKYSGALIK